MNEISPVNQEIRVHPSYSRWLTEEVFNLIDMVRRDEAIYNPRHKYYFCRPYVENFWREIDIRLRKNSGASLAKWTNLRISFRREYANFQEEKIAPCWSYFDRMLFLHPYLRNKKSSEPKVMEAHLHEAIAQMNSQGYKMQQHLLAANNKSESPVNEYMDHYLSYCEDDPQPTAEELEDIIEEEDNPPSLPNLNNSTLNDIKSEMENDIEEKDSHTQTDEHDEFKDIIIEISDDTQPEPTLNELNQLSPQDLDCGGGLNRSLLKRARTELAAAVPVSAPSSITPSNNVSLVRPLTLAVSHPSELNMFQQSIVSSSHANNRGEQQGSPASGSNRRNDLCECKTDPDAMFLMSLLPDIRKLNGRDRGKIKIAFQNIVQEFLYPD